MEYTVLDMQTYPRAKQLEYFRGMAYPYCGVTAEVDITGLKARLKAKDQPFYLSLLYAGAAAANAQPAFRQRLLHGGVVEFPHCDVSYTVALPDGDYCYCRVPTDLPPAEFYPRAQACQRRAVERRSLSDGEDGLSLFFFSSLPGLSYTALVQPACGGEDSNPRITWGRFFEREGRTLLPVTLLCHHALVDGAHLTRFYQLFAEKLAAL